MLYVKGRVLVDVPPWAPADSVPTFVTHFHADHWIGLKSRLVASRARLVSPTLQHAILLMTAFGFGGVKKMPVVRRFPLRLGDGLFLYAVPTVHTFEAYNALLVDTSGGYAVFYTADTRMVPRSSIELVASKLERHGVKRLVVAVDATYFGGEGVEPPPGAVVDAGWVVEKASEMPVVMPVLSTGRWASLLRLLEESGYSGVVVLSGRSLVTVYEVVGGFRQRRWEREFYPARPRRLVVTVASVRDAADMVARRVPGVYLVAGGMLQSTAARMLAGLALKEGFPVVVSASQLPGTPGAEMLRRGRVYKLSHPMLRGHMLPEEWWRTLAELHAAVQADIVLVPAHTSAEGADRFRREALEHGYPVAGFELLSANGTPVIRTRLGRALLLSGIAPEEPDAVRSGRGVVVFDTVKVYTPAA